MGATGGTGIGFERVDDEPDQSFLFAAMDATAGWEATIDLRTWERQQLGLRPGQRLLDVGCGLGDGVLAHAADLGAAGELVGIDASEAMLRMARQRASGADCRMRFSVGDAQALDEPDASFDAARSERMLQWVPEPAVVVAELTRVVRPGGRLVLIDSDWSTFTFDVGDDDLAGRVHATMRQERARPSNIGGRLADLVRAAGLTDVVETSATHTWTAWDPDASPAPAGFFSIRDLADDLVATRQLEATDVEAFVTTVEGAAREGCFRMALTIFAVAASVPSPG